MLRNLFFIFLLAAVPGVAQKSGKNVVIIVTDAFTGKPVAGAEVELKEVIGKYRRTTNAEGKAFFELFLATKSFNASYSVKFPPSLKNYKPYTARFRLDDSKDVFEFTAPVQSDRRKVSFRISDDKRQPVTKATAKLKDDGGYETVAKTDEKGIANFELSPTAQYKNALLTVVKEGFNDYSVPVEIDAQTTQISVVASLAAKVTIVDAFPDQPKEKKELLPPTINVTPTSMPPGYFAIPGDPTPSWGPYTPACDVNPLASVPIYTPLSVEDEKTLLDNISTSCIGAAGDAVNALVDVTENIVSLGSRMNAIWSQAFQNKEIKQILPASQKSYDDTKKLVEEEREKTKKAAEEAFEKTKELFDKMKELAEGPEMYVLSCMWDGFKDYAVPEPLTKLKKSTEAFGKAKTAMQEKLEAIKKRLESGEGLKFSDKALFTDWKDVTENVEKATSGLNLIVSYINDPKKVLPYETQMNLAISTGQKMLGSLMTDCQVREADRQIKQGIIAGQAALTAARKFTAQMKKGESKWRQIINDYVFKNFKQEDRGWEYFSANDARLLMLPQGAYNSWANYHNDAITGDKNAARLEETLKKLTELCNRVQPMAATLNERVNKYEGLYTKGLVALEACKLDEAKSFVEQLKTLEKGECGHFFPKPYGKTKSEELDNKIKAAIQTGKCKEAGIDAKLAGTWYKCEGGYTITISGNTGNASLIWDQDVSFWEKPNNWRVKDPRVFSNVKVNGNKITGRWESAPEYETYLPGSELGKKKVHYSGTFEFELTQSNYGPVDERITLSGSSVYDSEACKGCIETWCFIRVKKWK